MKNTLVKIIKVYAIICVLGYTLVGTMCLICGSVDAMTEKFELIVKWLKSFTSHLKLDMGMMRLRIWRITHRPRGRKCHKHSA